MSFSIRAIFLCILLSGVSASADYTPEFYNDIVNNSGAEYLSRIHKALCTHLKSPTVEVKVEWGKASESLGGKLKTARIEMDGGYFNKLKIVKAGFLLVNPVLDVDKLWKENELILKKCERIEFQIEILEQDLNDFLASREDSINVNSPTVKMLDDEIQLNGSGEIFKVRVKFHVEGKFELSGGKKINFVPRKVKFNSIPIPKIVYNNMIRRVNPVLDLEKFPFDLQIEQIIIKPGLLFFKNGDMK